MDIIILDLEWNAAYSKKLKGYINEIIEFGAVKCDEQLRVIDTFSSFVKIQVGKKLSSIVSELTTIRDENLSDAMLFMQVSSRFKKWAGNSIILTWGTSDILTLIENCRYFSGSGKIPFLGWYMDLQRYCQKCLGADSGEQLGLNKAAELLGIDISELTHHRAIGDSLISLEILRNINGMYPPEPFVEDASKDEFYRKMTFKTTIICDMEHPLVTKKSLMFQCEKCGGETERLTKWQFKNKKFSADFKCRSCSFKFTGRVQFKEKYEGLVVNKKCIALPKIEAPRQPAEGPVGNMELVVKEGVGLLQFKDWDHLDYITHAFSTRIGGVSQGQFAAMNLGFGRGDSDKNVYKNYELITNALGVDKDFLVAGAQDHHTNIRRVNSENGGTGIYKPKDIESIDGLCTDVPGVTLVVYAADCVPVYYVDTVKKAIGLAHAGWRGTVYGMAEQMVKKMAVEFGTDPADLAVAIGPSISMDCFEVDEPCASEFLKLPGSSSFVSEKTGGKFLVDLWQCNISYLLGAGVKQENITVGGVCTMCNSDLVFSHRVTKGQRGSNAAFLMLKG